MAAASIRAVAELDGVARVAGRPRFVTPSRRRAGGGVSTTTDSLPGTTDEATAVRRKPSGLRFHRRPCIYELTTDDPITYTESARRPRW